MNIKNRRAVWSVSLLVGSTVLLSGCSSFQRDLLKRIFNIDDNPEYWTSPTMYNPSDEDMKKFDRMIEEQPSNAKLYRARAYAYKSLSKYERSIADLDKALSLQPNKAEWYDERAWAKYMTDDLAGSLKDYNKAIELKPADDSFYTDRANVFEAMGKKTEAMQDCDKAVSLNMSTRNLIDRADLALSTGDRKKAMADLNSAVELKDEFSLGDALDNRAKLFMLLGEPEKALADLKRRTETENDVYSFMDYAQLCKILNRNDECTRAYKAALQLVSDALKKESDDAYDLKKRAEIYAALGDEDSAKQDRRKAIDVYTSNLNNKSYDDPASSSFRTDEADILDDRADLYDEMKLTKEAQSDRYKIIELYSARIEKNPTDSQQYHNRALQWNYLKQPEKALRDFEKGASLSKDKGHLLVHAAESKIAMGDLAGARADLQKLLAVEKSDDSGILGVLARIEFASGNYENAVKLASRGIETDPESGEAYYYRSLAYSKLKKQDRANADMIMARYFEYEPEDAGSQ